MRWVTEARPHIDRCASAWFIRRFVDRRPTFTFLARGEAVPTGWTPFDLPGARFGHHGGLVTFDAFCAAYPQRSRALPRLADLVRDIDLGTFRRPESRGVDALLYGLLLAKPEDLGVLRASRPVIDGLFSYFEAEARA